MSLISFLALGRSISEVRGEPTRYRMREETMLPRFETPKREPAALPQPETPAVEVVEKIETTQGAPEPVLCMAPEAASAAASSDAQDEDGAASAEASGSPAVRSVLREAYLKVEASLRRWANREREKGDESDVFRAPVQGELSLDGVTVVRNDLCDSDIEVVEVAARVPTAEVSCNPQDSRAAAKAAANAATVRGRWCA